MRRHCNYQSFAITVRRLPRSLQGARRLRRAHAHFPLVTCHKYADAVHRFLTADLAVEGATVDFTKRNLVGIGQSLGAVSITILTNYSPLIPIPALILIEPMLSPAGAH